MSGIVGTNSGRGSGSIGAAAAGPTVSSSDPTVSTNADLGTQWANSTSGEFYILTDSTADSNVWTNVGSGSGNIEPIFYQGSSYGYTFAGSVNVICRFSLTSQADASDVGDLTGAYSASSGGKSSTKGFSQGSDGSPVSTQIDTFSFSSSANATDHGDLTSSGYGQGAASMSTHIYCAAGYGRTNVIDKCATSSSSNSTDVGDLTNAVWYLGGNSSKTYGYISAGHPANNVIQKWAFASDGNATDVGDLPTSRSHNIAN